MLDSIDTSLLMSGLSLCFTAYFWFVKARKERPRLEFHQLSNFRTSLGRSPDRQDRKRFSIQQLDTGGVLIVNHSIRQNSVVLFECKLRTSNGVVHGDWGYTGDDKPPWNIGPESSIAFSPACFFDVPIDFQEPDALEFELQFITASGHRFNHAFTKLAPRFSQIENQQTRRAA